MALSSPEPAVASGAFLTMLPVVTASSRDETYLPTSRKAVGAILEQMIGTMSCARAGGGAGLGSQQEHLFPLALIYSLLGILLEPGSRVTPQIQVQ